MRVPAAGVQEIAVGQDAALGRPVVPDVYSSAHSLSSPGSLPASGASEGRGGGASSGPITRSSRPARGGGQQLGMAAGQGRPARFQVAGQVFEFGGAQVGIDGHHRHAQRVEREPVQEEGGAVFKQQAGAVAVAVTGARIGGAQRLDGLGGRAIGQLAGGDAVGLGRFGQDAQEGWAPWRAALSRKA